MIEMDGSVKSGSGMLLRHGVSLATLLAEELHMWNIRAGRDKPGLRHQHRQAVLSCRDMSQGMVEGADVGSTEIKYKPGKEIKGGYYDWDIGNEMQNVGLDPYDDIVEMCIMKRLDEMMASRKDKDIVE